MKITYQERKYLKQKYKSEGLTEEEIYKRLGNIFKEERKITKNIKIKKIQNKNNGTTFKEEFSKLCNI